VTKVDFVAPAGSVLRLEKRQYTLPATVALERPGDKGKANRKNVNFVFPNVNGQTLVADGVILVFGYDETDVDRLASNTCTIGPDQLQQAAGGYAVIFEGTSASGQKIYRMTIGKKR
jgi:hypothetical protein